jgi:hypothetical protein
MSETDSPEVIKFLTLFRRLQDWCDDAPDELADLARTDSSVKDLCTELSVAAYFLSMNERRHQTLFAAPVNPAFQVAWRDFEERYESVLSKIWFLDLFPEFDAGELSETPTPDLQWDYADAVAAQQARGIDDAIEFAQFNADRDHRWEESQQEFIERILDGVAAWERLKRDTGFDLRGVFRRRKLIPFVLVPRRVAAKHSSADQLSMLKKLRHAHDAFVYGATYGALALMRSIMETVLNDHYGAAGEKLSDRIQSVRNRLPRGANAAALHRLRKLANTILHPDHERDEGLSGMNQIRLEKEIVSLLFVLRALIEGAK